MNVKLKYITLNYLKNRMAKGGSIVYCTSTAGLEWKKFKKEQNKVVHAKTWEEVQNVTKKLANSAPATFAYMYSKRCASQFACEQSVEFAKLGIRINNVLPGSTNTGMKQEFQDMVGSEENLIAQAGLAVLGLKKNLEAVSATNPIICALAKKMMTKQANGKALKAGTEEDKK